MAATFVVGDMVRLTGLKSNPSLNGAVGTVKKDGDSESRGRCGVQLQSPAEAVAAHPDGVSMNPLNLIKLLKCARLNCNEIGIKACTACFKESYCTVECQKADWKAHRPMCILIKLMPNTLVPFREICSISDKVCAPSSLGREKHIRLLELAALFVEHQFGKRVEGQSAYTRPDGDRLSNWGVEIISKYSINTATTQCILDSDSSGGYVKGCWAQTIPILKKSIAILEIWINQIGLPVGERTDVLTEATINEVYGMMSKTQYNLCSSYRYNYILNLILIPTPTVLEYIVGSNRKL